MELIAYLIGAALLHYVIVKTAVQDASVRSVRQLEAQTQLLLALARRQGVPADELAVIEDRLPKRRAA